MAELVVSVVVAAMMLVIVLARKLQIAYPILLLIAGLFLGVVPGMPPLAADPKLILLGALPPLLFYHAFLTSSRELRRNVGAIATLSVGLVVATAAVVALLGHFVFGLSLASSVVLGAMVGPTDPVAFLTIARRLKISPRITGILDGENLINDTAAIVLYTLGVEFILHDSFEPLSGLSQFLLGSAAGVAWGYLVGRIAAVINSRIEDPATAPVIVLLAAYLAFIPAEGLHISAVLAAVTAGRVIGSRSPLVDRPGTRISGYGFWEALVFLLTAALFFIMGLQLPVILADFPPATVVNIVLQGLVAALAVIILRMLVVYGLIGGSAKAAARLRQDARKPWAEATVIGWSGMRGGVSLTLALALPLQSAEASFPERGQLILIVYAVLIMTLLGQGISMPWVVRRVKLHPDTFTPQERDEAAAASSSAIRARIGELVRAGRLSSEEAELFSSRYLPGKGHPRNAGLRHVHHELLDAERAALLDLRKKGLIGDEVLREFERTLDLKAEAGPGS